MVQLMDREHVSVQEETTRRVQNLALVAQQEALCTSEGQAIQWLWHTFLGTEACRPSSLSLCAFVSTSVIIGPLPLQAHLAQHA